MQKKWGFLLDLGASSDIYNGNINDYWGHILK